MSVRDFPPRPQGAQPDSVPYQNWLDSLGQRQNIDLMQELTSVATGDEIAVFDVSETGNVKTKKATVSNIAAGAGAVIGPSSATDNAVVRFDSTTGKLVQNSAFIVDDSGYVSSFGGQIKFPATQSASSDANTLDDYEEGTFTPSFTFVTAGDLSVAYGQQDGKYTKIGNMVFADIGMGFTPTFTTSSGQARVSGFPFTAASGGTAAVGALRFDGITAAGYTDFPMQIVAGSSQANISMCATATVRAVVSATNYTSAASATLFSSLSYKV